MDTERLRDGIEEFIFALNQLENAAQQPKNEFLRDSVILRFEFAYESAWKMLKLRLKLDGVSVRSPKEALQASLRTGLIQNEAVWTEVQKQRSLISRAYGDTCSEQIYEYVLTQLLIVFRRLAERAKQWLIPTAE